MDKKTRFKIFARDNFICQYCGKNPIDDNVILEVDHCISKKDGGVDDDNNLITACFDCNRGKGKKSVIIKKITIDAELKNKKEQLEQISKMLRLRNIKKKIINKKFEWINDYTEPFTDEFKNKITLIIKKQNEKGTSLELLESCLDITCNKFNEEDFISTSDFIKYFYGVLKHKIQAINDPEGEDNRINISRAISSFYKEWGNTYLHYSCKVIVRDILTEDYNEIGSIIALVNETKKGLEDHYSSYSNKFYSLLSTNYL